jgi:hypothetical protein
MFWPIGLLILAIIPLVFFRHIATDPFFRIQCTMEINLPPSEDFFKAQKRMHPDIDFPPSGNWKKFAFTENDISNELRLPSLRNEIKRYIQQRDTIRGIQISFSRQMKYEMFVKTIDILNLENATRYAIWHSNVWLPRFARSTHRVNEYHLPICGGVHTIYNPVPLTKLQLVQQEIKECYFYLRDALQQLPLPVILVLFAILVLNIYQIYHKRLAA